MEPVTLTTERLLLRVPASDDIDTVYAACQDPDTQRWTTVPSPYRRRHAEDYVERLVPDGWRGDTAYTFGVRPLGGGPLIASVSLQFPRSGTWEVGYWTAREHRGRGYMTEAVRAVSHWAFTTLDAVRVEWRAEAGNLGSRAVAEKAGFVVEGTLRGGLLHRGTVRDCWIGGLLPHDLGLPGTHPYLPAPA
ncbi:MULTISPECIES: GNAT family N-acetyltransferase [unclassified Streptomyces]|uniref:GNAT family N-acetyltransferase n=1 Tax=unclassified Streptomyces TaxID=2593676 RepID=UPI0037F92DFD